MNRATLVLLGAPLLLLGYLGAPLCWHDEGMLPNLALRLALWLAASAGSLLLWLALVAEDDTGHRTRAPRLAAGQPQPA